MSNGWDWIREGQRIAEEARQAGELDVEAIKAASIVFPAAETSRPKPPAGYYECLTRRCEPLYYENEVGGQARGVVGQIARALGVELSPPLDGNIWSPANMQRVVDAAKALANEVEVLRDEHQGRDKNNNKTVAALREALVHLGEGV